ncbi:MAG: response regulator [Nitrospirae bacterium]|nr:response regulator [Nitrospirota bacterium]
MERIIYVADDLASNVNIIEAAFSEDPDIIIKKAYNGRELLDLINSRYPDLIILDLMMPVMSGFDVLRELKDVRDDNYFPVIVLSGLSDKENVIEALDLSADDYIIKPYFIEELKTKVYNMLKLKERDEILKTPIDVMVSNLKGKLNMLERTQIEIIIRLGKASEFRDDETGKHTERIAEYVSLISRQLNMNEESSAMLKHASPMHDVGKIGIPDRILLKSSKLTDEEFKIIKLHTVIGEKILSGTTLPLIELAKEIALSHHERWDGGGYPRGLKGSSIPLSGRIVAIADVFDAVSSIRQYKEAWDIEQTLTYIRSQRERHFDPDVADAFFNVVDDILLIKKTKGELPRSKAIIKRIIDGDVSVEELIEKWR